MALQIEITPQVTDLSVNPTATVVEVQLMIPYAGGNAIEKTVEIHDLEVVNVLPGTPDPKTIYFIV